MLRGSGSIHPCPALKPTAKFSSAITQNQWYDAWTGLACAAGAGSAKKLVRIISIGFEQAVANEDLELRIIADGQDETISQTAVAGTNYFIRHDDNPDDAVFFTKSSAAAAQNRAFLCDAVSVQIMYRKTSNNGANNTTIKIIYGQW